MSSFGDKLRREREMRGVTLEEISESTKIGTRSLRALEQEDFEKLPGGIFNKGFVRAYSRFLGLDEDQTVADFDLAWNEHESAKGPAPEPLVEERPEPEPSTPKLLLAVVLVVIAVSAGWYALHNYRGARTLANQHPTTAVNDSQRISSAQPPLSSPLPVTPADRQSSSTVSNPAATKEPSDSPKPVSNSNTPETVGALGRANDKPASGIISKAANSSAPIRLEIFAREDSWLSILADGKSMGQGVLNAQKSRTIHAQKEVRLTVGNAGGVEVSFNGQAVDIGGQPNQVKELIFTSEGLQR